VILIHHVQQLEHLIDMRQLMGYDASMYSIRLSRKREARTEGIIGGTPPIRYSNQTLLNPL